MATIMNRIKSIPQHLPYGTAHKGLKGVIVDKGERFAAAAAFGYSKGYYGDRFIWKGHGADLWLGVGALGLATLASMFGGHKAGEYAEHLERVGDAGVMSAIGSLAAAYGLEKAGHTVHVTAAPAGGKKLPAKTATQGIAGDVLGMIPGAKAGPYLSNDQMMAFANRR